GAGQAAGVQLGQVVPHHHGGLDQQAGHADDVRALFGGRVHDRGQRLLDADVDDVVAIVGQDDVDQVLADVVYVTTNGREHDPALEPFPERQPGKFGRPAGLQFGRVHALEQLEQPGQRVVTRSPAVVDQVERDLQLLVTDPRDRHDPRGVHDRRVQPGTDALVLDERG